MNQKKLLGVILIVVPLIGLAWYLRALDIVHFLVYNVMYARMELLFAVVLSVILTVVITHLQKSDKPKEVKLEFGTMVFMGLVVLLIPSFLFMGSIASQTTVVNDHMNFEERDEMKQTASDDMRLLPMKVGDTYAQNRLQFERHKLSQGDITIQEDGRMAWSYNIIPEGIGNRMTIHQAGASTVDMTQTDANVQTTEKEVVPGVGDFMGDNVFWELRKENYWVDYKKDEAYVVNRNDNLYLAVPYVEHKPEFNFPYPFPYTTPHPGGLALVDSETGDIEFVDVDEVQEHEILEDQRAVSYDVTRYYVDSMTYNNGVMNALFFKEDVPEVASSPGDGNEQPYLVQTENGELTLLIAAEPAGDASGIYQTYYQNAQTGEWERHSADRGDAMVGPERSTDYVQAEAPTVDWDEFTPVEPLPIIREDGLFWMTRVIPDSGGGVSYIAFVDAESNDVIPVADDETARAFIAGDIATGDDLDDIGTDPISDDGSVQQSQTTITIVQEDGSTEDIELESGSEIVIGQE